MCIEWDCPGDMAAADTHEDITYSEHPRCVPQSLSDNSVFAAPAPHVSHASEYYIELSASQCHGRVDVRVECA